MPLYYTNAQLLSDTDVHSTKGANSSKVKCFSHTRKEDELCIQFAVIRDCKCLPNSTSSIKCKATFDKYIFNLSETLLLVHFRHFNFII